MAVYLGTVNDDALNDRDSEAGESDVLQGFCGDDFIFLAQGGADSAFGGSGDDSLYAGNDVLGDRLFGGSGDDRINWGYSAGNLLDGGSRDEVAGDTLSGSASSRTGSLWLDLRTAGQGGSALVNGGTTVRGFENFVLFGGTQNDVIFAPTDLGADYISRLYGNAGDDQLIGGAYSDYLETGNGVDFAFGGAGDDEIAAMSSVGSDLQIDTLVGGLGNDLILAGVEDYISGGEGVDVALVSMESLAGPQTVDLRSFDPSIAFGLGAGGSIEGVEFLAVLTGGAADTAYGSDRADGFFLGDGSDVAVLGGGADIALLGRGSDYVEGGEGADLLSAADFAVTPAYWLEYGLVNGAELALSALFFFELILGRFNDGGSDTLLGGADDDIVIFGTLDFADGGANGSLGDLAMIDLSGSTANLSYDFAAYDPSGPNFFELDGGGGMSGFERIALATGSGDDTVIDTDREGAIIGGAGGDTLVGGGGDDLLSGGQGNDYLNGGLGEDQIDAGAGADIVFGGDGDDNVEGGGGADTLIGEAGDDYLEASNLTYFDGGEGLDTVVVVFEGVTTGVWFDFAPAFDNGLLFLEGGGSIRGADRGGVETTEANDTIFDADWGGYVDALGGDDVIVGRGGNDALDGGDGNDFIDAGTGDDTVAGGAGSDIIYGGAGNDSIGAPFDVSLFEEGFVYDPFISYARLDRYNDDAADVIYGEDGQDRIFGWAGDDILDGGADNDVLDGGDGRDQLVGGDGADTLVGGCDIDFLTGGAGADTFVFDADGVDYDIVQDFSAADGDRFNLDGRTFTGLVTGDFDGDGTLDTQVGFSGGTIVVLGVSGLTLDAWNEFVV